MKKSSIVLLLSFTAILFACNSESEEVKTTKAVQKAISEFVSPDSLSTIHFKDTISLLTVNETIARVDSMQQSIDSFISTIPSSIEAAEKRKKEAEVELENLKFKMLKGTWESIVMTEEQTIQSYKDMLKTSNRNKELNTIKYNFAKKAQSHAVEDVAYFVVEGIVNGSARLFFVSPKYIVLNSKK